MGKLICAILLGTAAAFAMAQQQPQPPQKQEQLDKDAEARIRAERSAGGLGKVTPEDKAGASVGAGPHKQTKPSGAAKR